MARGTVYFAPSNYHLLVDRGPQLAPVGDELVYHSRPSIDVLFESAADVYRDRLLGIILTGANEDGAAGLAAVQAGGGITVVQEPGTARSPQWRCRRSDCGARTSCYRSQRSPNC